MDFNSIHQATVSFQKLKAFVDDGGLLTAVTAIGDVELEAAKLALERAQSARRKRELVRSAATHLESAHTAFRRTYAVTKEERNPKWLLRADIGEDLAAAKDLWTLVLLAMCDLALGEKANMEEVLEKCETAYAGYFGSWESYQLMRQTALEGEERGFKALGQFGRATMRRPDLAFDAFAVQVLKRPRALLHPFKEVTSNGDLARLRPPHIRDFDQFRDQMIRLAAKA